MHCGGIGYEFLNEVPERIVHGDDGRYHCFWAATDETPLVGGSYRIDDHWTDRRGNLWFKI